MTVASNEGTNYQIQMWNSLIEKLVEYNKLLEVIFVEYMKGTD